MKIKIPSNTHTKNNNFFDLPTNINGHVILAGQSGSGKSHILSKIHLELEKELAAKNNAIEMKKTEENKKIIEPLLKINNKERKIRL